MELEELLQCAKIEKDGVIPGIKSGELNILVSGDTDRCLAIQYKEKNYFVSDRAKKNIFKLTGYTNRLMKELPLGQVVSDLNFQIRKFTVGIIVVDDIVISVFNQENSYVGYADLLNDVKDKILFVSGDPIGEDYIQVQFKGSDEADAEGYIVGRNAIISSTGNVSSIFRLGVFDTVSKSWWVDGKFAKAKFQTLDTKIIPQILDASKKDIDEFAFFVSKNREVGKKLPLVDTDHLDGLLESLSASRKIKHAVNKIYEHAAEYQDLLNRIGLKSINNVWEVFLLLILIASGAPNSKLVTSVGIKSYDWLNKIIAPVRK